MRVGVGVREGSVGVRVGVKAECECENDRQV